MAEQLDPQQEPIPVTTTFLDLPAHALQQIVLFLPDPGPLAATCHTTAAQMDEDGLLLAWAGVWIPGRAEPQEECGFRHPGYALLQWRRLYCMGMQRLGELLLRWVASQPPWAAEDSNAQQQAHQQAQQAQQQLERGEPVAALRALLPHSGQLLLLYAAQAGHVQLLCALLAAPDVSTQVQLQWDAHQQAACNLLLPAIAAAAHGGHVAAVQLLLEEMEFRGELSSLMGDHRWHLRVLATAVQSGARSVACLKMLLSKLGRRRDSKSNEDALLQLAAHGGCTAVVEVLLGAGMVGHDNSRYRASWEALRFGHRHLLPLLRPASMSDDEDIQLYWRVASLEGLHGRPPPPCAELVEEFRAIGGSGPDASKSRCLAVAVAVHCNSVRALSAMWDEAKQQLPSEEQALLALAMLERLSWATQLETVRWVFLFALPVLQRGAQLQHLAAIDAAMRMVLSYGLHGLQPQPPLGSENDPYWLYAKQQGQLMWAVRHGDPVAVQQALLGFGALGQEPGVVSAVQLAATVLGPAEAETRARVLLPALDAGGNVERRVDEFLTEVDGTTGQLFCLAHGGRLLRWAVELSQEVRAAVVGVRSRDLLHQACSAGLLDIAKWLVMHPEQRHDYLSDVFDSPWAWERFQGVQWWRTFAALLHRLAAAAHGAAEEVDAGAARAAGAATASVHGGGEAGAVAGVASKAAVQPPAGARVLEPWLLQAVLRSGMPDVLHALLVYMDAWKQPAGD